MRHKGPCLSFAPAHSPSGYLQKQVCPQLPGPGEAVPLVGATCSLPARVGCAEPLG